MSKTRIDNFVSWFIVSEYVSNWSAEKDSDVFNEPERAARVHDAAEYGCDGRTHAEVIEDWREAFKAWVRDMHKTGNSVDRFEAAVEAHFDAIERWHEKNGSLWQEIG